MLPRSALMEPPVTGNGITTDKRCKAVCTLIRRWRRSQSSRCTTSDSRRAQVPRHVCKMAIKPLIIAQGHFKTHCSTGSYLSRAPNPACGRTAIFLPSNQLISERFVMKDAAPQTIYLSDYAPFGYLVDAVGYETVFFGGTTTILVSFALTFRLSEPRVE